MRVTIAVAIIAWTAQFSGPAAADLYRWIDPESGSIKYSSYPPPWYGDPARERRSPMVQVIRERAGAPSSGPRPEVELKPKPQAKPEPEPEPAAVEEKRTDGS